MYNSLQQDPCKIAMKIGGVCAAGSKSFTLLLKTTASSLDTEIWIITPLHSGERYGGTEAPTPCTCNTVFYSLLAACSICQGNEYTTWGTTPFYTLLYRDFTTGFRLRKPTAQPFTHNSAHPSFLSHFLFWPLFRYPATIPGDTAVPHYAYLDVQVCLKPAVSTSTWL